MLCAEGIFGDITTSRISHDGSALLDEPQIEQSGPREQPHTLHWLEAGQTSGGKSKQGDGAKKQKRKPALSLSEAHRHGRVIS